MTKNTTMAKIDKFRGILTKIEERTAEVLPKHLKADTLTRCMLVGRVEQPKLEQCTTESLALALLQCAQLGLEPFTPLGEAWILPYGSKATFIGGYKGYAKVCLQSGEIARIAAKVFYQAEIEAGAFEASHEPPRLRHDWMPGSWPDDEIAGAWCVIETKDGARLQLIMSREEIEKHRAKSKQPNGIGWGDNYPAMCRKTAMLGLLKGGTVPMSPELRNKMAVAWSADPDAQYQERPRPTQREEAIDAFAQEVKAEVVDSETGEVTAPEMTPYAQVAAKAEALGFSQGDLIDVSIKAGLGPEDIHPDDWTQEHATRLVAELEHAKKVGG